MKQLIPILIFIAILAFLVAMNIYQAKRFAWYFGAENTKLFYIFFAALTVFLIGGLAIFSNASGLISNILYSIAAVGLGFMIYLIMAILAMDLIHLAVKLPASYYGLSAVLIAGIISLFGMINARNLQVKELEISLKGLNKEVRIMHLTDIHIGHWHGVKYLKRIVEETNKQHVDYVFFTGDLFDGKIRLNQENLEPLTKLNAPVFFVEGNHDGYTGATDIKTMLRDIGVQVLENQVLELNGFQLIGLNHMLADENAFDMHAGSHNTTIKSTLAGLNTKPEMPSVLLHHSPDGIRYASEKGIGLYLAGHTHAGQLFPITLLNEWIFPYNKGLHKYGNTQIYVSPGAGTFGPPMRVGTRSEITLLILTTDQ